jgi:hypothetical protein
MVFRTTTSMKRGRQMKDQLATDVTDRFISCLLGGAVGDALGAPIRFMTRREIVRRFGPSGVRDYVPVYGGIGRITDDTQMTLFTADGVIRSAVRDEHKGITTVEGVTAHAYLRWLLTQGERPDNDLVFGMEIPGWLYPFQLCTLSVRPETPVCQLSRPCGTSVTPRATTARAVAA